MMQVSIVRAIRVKANDMTICTSNDLHGSCLGHMICSDITAKQRKRMGIEKKKPVQIRMTPEMVDEYSKNANQHFRTLPTEVLFRLAVLDTLIARGEVNLNEFKF